MRQYLKEIFVLMGEDKKKLPWLLVLFFLVSFLDILGIGLIAPYVSMVMEPDHAIDFFSNSKQGDVSSNIYISPLYSNCCTSP